MKCRACVLVLSFVVAVCIAESASAYYNPSLGLKQANARVA